MFNYDISEYEYTHFYTINNIQLNSLTEFTDLGIIFNIKLTLI